MFELTFTDAANKEDGMEFGYCRVSTSEQNLDRQIDALVEHGIERERIYTDKISGVAESRPGLDRLMAYLRPGDSVTVLSFDRLARSLRQLLATAESLEAMDVSLVSLKEGLDSGTPQGRLQMALMGAMAQFEREMIRERQREGIEAAKARGRHLGRPATDPAKLDAALLMFAGSDRSVAEITEATGVGRTVIYREARSRGITRQVRASVKA
jgi:DNA invertase Pin-like site-specific DNA recombinase